MNPRAPITPVHFGDADLNALLDISGFNLDTILDIDPDFLANDSHHHDHADHGHEHDEHCAPDCDHHHHHAAHDDEISAFVFRSNKAFNPERLEDFLGGVIQVYGPDLLRYKGVLYIKGINRRLLFQGVHMMMGAEPGKPWLSGEKPNTKMVFIGRKLPRDVITQGLEQCLV